MFVDLSPVSLAAFQSPGPEIFRVGPLVIRWYGVLIAAAIVLGLQLSQRLAKHRRIKPELISDLAIWLVVGAIPCARIYYVLFQWDYYSQHLDQVATIWRGGIAIHGAILGGMLAAVIFSRLNKVSFWQLADLVAPSLVLGQAIGRWGNFFNSEAFGDPTDLPWKLFIPSERRPLGYKSSAYFHPTFLYESLWNLMVLGLLLALFFRFPRAKKGTLFLAYALTYSLGRLWIEGLRTDSLMLGPLRIAQVVSLIGIGVGLLGLSWLYLLKRSLPDTKQAS
ncbi:prolipoprotein diacylglyceryl transferase [Acaryochloris sp. IP29b_bin.148]|uniref:prolipoprotein diacylglyceryl transferase n=1 Tax=Acaryochloris sp. IP29b_bin.148 TaxID=2969218 RepID=UPI0026372E25|nr:prolipoprotein diacylglyceryl transferase [Acaryochloris sp. IP29b_bin.148]